VEHALPRFVDGRFKIFVEKVFKMEEIQEAHKLLESNKTKGKIICTV
jgi:NADPH:quinone reductase-like Zn-dependent oxidoreductase